MGIVAHMGEDLRTARLALRKLMNVGSDVLTKRRSKLLKWRPFLALRPQLPECTQLQRNAPGVAEIVLKELRALQSVWRHQLPWGSLDLNASKCEKSHPMGPKCGALLSMLPQW